MPSQILKEQTIRNDSESEMLLTQMLGQQRAVNALIDPCWRNSGQRYYAYDQCHAVGA